MKAPKGSRKAKPSRSAEAPSAERVQVLPLASQASAVYSWRLMLCWLLLCYTGFYISGPKLSCQPQQAACCCLWACLGEVWSLRTGHAAFPAEERAA